MSKLSPILKWWVTPFLPIEDIFADNVKEKRGVQALKVRLSQWVIHPIKRRVARAYLRFLKGFTGIKVVAITGSAGKSTTVQMLASILKASNKVVATPPSIDPVYNIPNTIVKCSPWTKYLILEMSVEYPNEMDYYLWLAKPDVGMILNIYPTHTEFFGDERGVFNEKRKLVDSLSKKGLAVLNHGDKTLRNSMGKIKAKTVWFGKEEPKPKLSNEFTLKIGESKIIVHMPTLGRQFVLNAMAAAVCARELGATAEEIKRGLESFITPEHRMSLLRHKSGALILDDVYNNNPQAAKEALETFSDFAGNRRKVVVMGDMLELGRLEEKYHQELGEIIGKMEIDHLVGVGEASKVMVASAEKGLGRDKTTWVSGESKVLRSLSPFLKKNYAILIKGSRSIHLENVVEALSKQ
ncbi:UDP-N-acetylmuramoyl-tripeptide--D-alanyl-D-alanine ligase [Candidatus Woesebacteria bacterium]|nr:UDP-N-acetylmuramoyl-tripeptide--D-alanyl-D-alanine ligase [Candidatus Woesebacteria bacterium]